MSDELTINTDDVQTTEAARKLGVESIFNEIEKRRKREPAPKPVNYEKVIKELERLKDVTANNCKHAAGDIKYLTFQEGKYEGIKTAITLLKEGVPN